MTFPLISIGRMRLDPLALTGRFAVFPMRTIPRTALFPFWRLQLDSLSESELWAVEEFLRTVKTQGFWSVRLADTMLHHCLLIEARRTDWHDPDGIGGWIVFSADMVDREGGWHTHRLPLYQR